MARVSSTGKETSSNFSPANGTGSAVRTAIKDVFESIRTLNSASGDPSGTANLAAYQPHIDSDTNLLKIRNAANSAFITLGNVSEANFGHLDLSGGTLTGVLGLPNGSAGSPSIHVGDSTTGLFRKGSNQIGLSFSGTEKAFFDQNGLTLQAQTDVRFADSDSSNYVALQSPATVSSNVTFTLPAADGSNGQFLTTDGSGNLSFAASSNTLTIGSTTLNLPATITALAGMHQIAPATNNTYSLGTDALRWSDIFTNDLNLSNEGGKNDIDGTWGSYKIQEGEEHLYLTNLRNGKKYKFNLTEVT
tara:strand:+ start:19 stop:930 length:912 start_codon:yes stop_codon:yes gene_type:complete